jgi:hypothetical protein
MHLAGQALSMIQTSRQHEEAVGVARTLHMEVADQIRRHHVDSLGQEALHQSRESALKRQLFAAQRAFAVDMARREAVRDVWQQRNELTQTMLIVATLLFGCAYTTLVDGRIANEASRAAVVAFSFFVSLSLLLLLVCIVSLVALYRRIALYDIHRPLLRYTCNRIHRDFNSYYECHCGGLHATALVLFYVGSLTTYIGCSLLYLTKIHLWYRDSAASVSLFVIPFAGSLLFIVIASWVWPDKTHSGAVDYGGLSGEQMEYDQEMRDRKSSPTSRRAHADGRIDDEDAVAMVRIDSGGGSVPT